MTLIEFWDYFVGKNEQEFYDYTGQLVKKAASSQPRSPFGWVVEYIQPLEKGGENSLDNVHIVSMRANYFRDGKITFKIDGALYQVQKNGQGGYFNGQGGYFINKLSDANLDFWTQEFGESLIAYDFCGREVRKGSYGQTNSRYGWSIDHIMPISKGGNNGAENKQVAHIESNAEKADKTTFEANGSMYQIKRTSKASTEELDEIDYDYSNKKYCVVNFVSQPKEDNNGMTDDEVWVNEFGNVSSAKDYDEDIIYRNQPDGWVIETLGKKADGNNYVLSNIHIVSIETHRIRHDRTVFSIKDERYNCEVFYQLKKNDGTLSKNQMSQQYDYSEKDYYINRVNLVRYDDDDDGWDN